MELSHGVKPRRIGESKALTFFWLNRVLRLGLALTAQNPW